MARASIECRHVKDVRELRIWHWRNALRYRAVAREYEVTAKRSTERHPNRTPHYENSHARQNHGLADFHISAVQALNDFLPDTTAEQDEEAIRNEQVSHKRY